MKIKYTEPEIPLVLPKYKDKLSQLVSFRVDPETKYILDYLRDKERVNIGAFIRKLIVREFQRFKDSAEIPDDPTAR